MNYSDFGDIIEDEFTGSIFGEKSQLKVLGWVEKKRDSYGKYKKIYLLECSICKQDKQLFGDAVFKASKSNLTAGRCPCGCAVKPVWTPEQWAIRVSRKLDPGHKLVSLIETEKGAFGKVEILCEKYGTWDTASANNIMNGQGCRLCANAARGLRLKEANSYTEEQFTEKFYIVGGYSRDIIFTRVSKNYWSYTCNVCGVSCKTHAKGLYAGTKSCNCSKFNPLQAYINFVMDGELPVALKFGISQSALNRRFRWSVYDFHLYSVWVFKNRVDCLSAEALCKTELDTGVIPKIEMPDGYSETTYIYNLEKIIEVYKSLGGIEIMRNSLNELSS